MVDPRVVADLARARPPGVQADDHRVQPAPFSFGPCASGAASSEPARTPGAPRVSKWPTWRVDGLGRGPAQGRLPRAEVVGSPHSMAQVLGRLGPQSAPPQPPRGRTGSSPRAPVITGLSGVDPLEQAAPRPRSRSTAGPHRARQRACSSPQSPSISVSPSIRAYTDH